MKESLEEELRNLGKEPVYGSELSEKLKNVMQKAKKALQEKEMICLNFNHEFLEQLIVEENIADLKDAKNLTTDIWMSFAKKFKLNYDKGIKGKYIFFEDTPISEDTKKDIAKYKEIESKVGEYVKSCNGKPNPKEFQKVVYSLLPEEIRNNPEDGRLLNPKTFVYYEMKKKFQVKEYENLDQLEKDIRSELEKL